MIRSLQRVSLSAASCCRGEANGGRGRDGCARQQLIQSELCPCYQSAQREQHEQLTCRSALGLRALLRTCGGCRERRVRLHVKDRASQTEHGVACSVACIRSVGSMLLLSCCGGCGRWAFDLSTRHFTHAIEPLHSWRLTVWTALWPAHRHGGSTAQSTQRRPINAQLPAHSISPYTAAVQRGLAGRTAPRTPHCGLAQALFLLAFAAKQQQQQSLFSPLHL